jgi:hypothetical protein
MPVRRSSDLFPRAPARRALLRAGALAAAAVACGAARAAPVADLCPRELTVRQTVAADVAGWTALNQQEGYPFARIAFYLGPPEQGARQVPTYERRDAAGLHDVWRLLRRPAEYWVSCEYANTSARIARKLEDDGNNWCEADYDGRFATLIVKRWHCIPAPPPRPAARAPSATRAAPAKAPPRAP